MGSTTALSTHQATEGDPLPLVPRPLSKLRIHYHAEPRDAEVPYFLAQELIPDYWGDREGTYCPPKGYFVADENPAAFEAYEATFPYKEKLRLPGQLGYEE